MSRNLKGNIMLVMAAFIWGASFAIQDMAAKCIEPFALNGIRSLIGLAVLFPLALIMSKKVGKPIQEQRKKEGRILPSVADFAAFFSV